jgi:DNA-directed RNA polymerase subunit RPC12/RpoP
MEQSRNIGPKYAIRLCDLRAWHKVAARCFKCGHSYEFTADFLAWERPEHTRLTDLERKLRCTRCGNRQANTLSVRTMPRN